MMKSKIQDFAKWNIVDPLSKHAAELLFQNIFTQQCSSAGLRELFYPVGAAANYGLLYLLFRALNEQEVGRIIELGSGQSTILIDRVRSDSSSHVCYENDHGWFEKVRPRLNRCEYRHSPLGPKTFDSVSYRGYSTLSVVDFNLLLVDGPGGTDHFSRFDAVELITANRAEDFLVIFDDAERPGERETIDRVVEKLEVARRDYRLNYLVAAKTQAVFSFGRFRDCSYYF